MCNVSNVKNENSSTMDTLHEKSLNMMGNMIISTSMNINLGHLGGASILRMFTTTRPHGSVNTTTWLAISQFF